MATPPSKTRVLTAHVPVLLAIKVDKLAERLKRSRGWIVKQALSSWIAHQELRDGLTLEAMNAVDVGEVVDHDSVQAWAESLSAEKPLPLPRSGES